MPSPSLASPWDNIDATVGTRLVWELRTVGADVEIPDYLLRRAETSREAVTLLRVAVEDAAHRIAKHIRVTAFMGERKETRTDTVSYRGETSYHHHEVWGQYVADQHWIVPYLILVFFPLYVWLFDRNPRIERRWADYTGTTPYAGTRPYSYVHSTMLDPFIEDHYGPLRREPYVEVAAYDYANARVRVER